MKEQGRRGRCYLAVVYSHNNDAPEENLLRSSLKTNVLTHRWKTHLEKTYVSRWLQYSHPAMWGQRDFFESAVCVLWMHSKTTNAQIFTSRWRMQKMSQHCLKLPKICQTSQKTTDIQSNRHIWCFGETFSKCWHARISQRTAEKTRKIRFQQKSCFLTREKRWHVCCWHFHGQCEKKNTTATCDNWWKRKQAESSVGQSSLR